MSQSQPLRIESSKFYSFATSRAINSRLWFVNNSRLERSILGNLAKYSGKHEVELYGFNIQGNHYHVLSRFPQANRAAFYRDFNARTAECVRRFVPSFEGGPLFERRYSEQALPTDSDLEDRFFYTALQVVYAGLAEQPLHYPGYNSFYDAIRGKSRRFRVVNWAAYNAARREKKRVSVKDYTTEYELKYKRLPGYEGLSQAEYAEKMLAELEKRRVAEVERLKAKGHRFMSRKALRQTTAGSTPQNTKKSTRYSYRPLVLTSSPEARKAFLEWYFSIYERYKQAVEAYRNHDRGVEFPPGTYPPPGVAFGAT